MQLQFVVTLTFRQTEMPVIARQLVTNTPSVKMLSTKKKKCFHSYFRKNVTFVSADVLRIGKRVKMCIGGLRPSLFHDRYFDNVSISNVTFIVAVVYYRLPSEYFRTPQCFAFDGCCNERVRSWRT
jgi:hypothetical protein